MQRVSDPRVGQMMHAVLLKLPSSKCIATWRTLSPFHLAVVFLPAAAAPQHPSLGRSDTDDLATLA